MKRKASPCPACSGKHKAHTCGRSRVAKKALALVELPMNEVELPTNEEEPRIFLLPSDEEHNGDGEIREEPGVHKMIHFYDEYDDEEARLEDEAQLVHHYWVNG